VALEWRRNGCDVEIEIDAPRSHNIFVREVATDQEESFHLRLLVDRLNDVIAKIAD
jgi:hypothetical protein